MPTYQYQCTECGNGLEAVQKFTDDALTVCPDCSGRLRKIYSAVGVVFKGSGFYRTDSRSSSSSTVGASKSTSSSGDSSSSSSSSSTPSTTSGASSTSSSASTSSSGGSSSGGSSSPAA
ncbi:FmdB family zinc ribbon protein [Streptacidiphilus albus]|uniref:FmdB family zinc ribbon protein n=1 Tax=Streptacidiphilus albus TaxID=105425 RepID=UPI0009E04C48|nr:FmdB family zinc ribbon protein [Streptacidiphilus albus]